VLRNGESAASGEVRPSSQADGPGHPGWQVLPFMP